MVKLTRLCGADTGILSPPNLLIDNITLTGIRKYQFLSSPVTSHQSPYHSYTVIGCHIGIGRDWMGGILATTRLDPNK